MIDLLTVSEVLGYREIQYPDFAITAYRSDLITSKLTELAAIDVALSEAALNSVADTVGDMKLQYAGHINILRSEGSRLLHEIANLAGIPLGYDRFKVTKQTYSFRSDYG